MRSFLFLFQLQNFLDQFGSPGHCGQQIAHRSPGDNLEQRGLQTYRPIRQIADVLACQRACKLAFGLERKQVRAKAVERLDAPLPLLGAEPLAAARQREQQRQKQDDCSFIHFYSMHYCKSIQLSRILALQCRRRALNYLRSNSPSRHSSCPSIQRRSSREPSDTEKKQEQEFSPCPPSYHSWPMLAF
jgi:hypothetical protein